MTLRKITFDNNVKSIPQNEQTRRKDSKLKTIKNISLPPKQNRNWSQNKKKFLAGGFGLLKYYFYLKNKQIR